MEERRRFPRYPCSLRVIYATKGIACLESATTAKNICKGGLNILVSRLIKKGDSLKLDIFNETNNELVKTSGKVRWINDRDAQSDLMVNAGVQFKNITPSEVDNLLATVR